jgi:hypothetical protein
VSIFGSLSSIDVSRFAVQQPYSTPLNMSATTDTLFQSAIETLSFPGVTVGHRLISPGDEHALMKEEVQAFATSVV